MLAENHLKLYLNIFVHYKIYFVFKDHLELTDGLTF
jgi:hypothetical protein